MIQWDDYVKDGTDTPTATKSASTARGWGYSIKHKLPIANYLDYEAVYRPSHYAGEREPCKLCQPGSILVTVYTCSENFRDPGRSYGWHWFPTVSEAKAWAESVAQNHHLLG